MAKRKIIWSHKAELRLFNILEFYAKETRVKLILQNYSKVK